MRSVFPEYRRVIFSCSVTSLLASFVSCMGRFYSSILLLRLLAYAGKCFECLTLPAPCSQAATVLRFPPTPHLYLPFLAIIFCCFFNRCHTLVLLGSPPHFRVLQPSWEGADLSQPLVPRFPFFSPPLRQFRFQSGFPKCSSGAGRGGKGTLARGGWR